jgi:hypothetical protein
MAALSADLYEEWMASGKQGQRELAAFLDQAVAELICDGLIGRDREEPLRGWLAQLVRNYFKDRVTAERAKEADDRWQKCSEAFELLETELPRLYNLEAYDVENSWCHPFSTAYHVLADVQSLKDIRGRAYDVSRRWFYQTSKKNNPAKPWVKWLGDQIRCFWMVGRTGSQDPDERLERPDPRIGSDYVRFARYI